jgi:hypothetical protein
VLPWHPPPEARIFLLIADPAVSTAVVDCLLAGFLLFLEPYHGQVPALKNGVGGRRHRKSGNPNSKSILPMDGITPTEA